MGRDGRGFCPHRPVHRPTDRPGLGRIAVDGIGGGWVYTFSPFALGVLTMDSWPRCSCGVCRRCCRPPTRCWRASVHHGTWRSRHRGHGHWIHRPVGGARDPNCPGRVGRDSVPAYPCGDAACVRSPGRRCAARPCPAAHTIDIAGTAGLVPAAPVPGLNIGSSESCVPVSLAMATGPWDGIQSAINNVAGVGAVALAAGLLAALVACRAASRGSAALAGTVFARGPASMLRATSGFYPPS